jgi:hypothetical protein
MTQSKDLEQLSGLMPMGHLGFPHSDVWNLQGDLRIWPSRDCPTMVAPELEKRCRLHLKPTTDSWCVDETYIQVRKVWMYLYRAVDSQGNTLEFLKLIENRSSGRIRKRLKE